MILMVTIWMIWGRYGWWWCWWEERGGGMIKEPVSDINICQSGLAPLCLQLDFHFQYLTSMVGIFAVWNFDWIVWWDLLKFGAGHSYNVKGIRHKARFVPTLKLEKGRWSTREKECQVPEEGLVISGRGRSRSRSKRLSRGSSWGREPSHPEIQRGLVGKPCRRHSKPFDSNLL